jgi:hypothetical protein
MKSSQHRCKISLLYSHKHSLCTQKSAELNSTDQKFIVHDCKVFDSTSFFYSHNHHESNRSYLARHWRSGQNLMISQTLHHRKHRTKDSCSSTLPRPPQLYPFLTSPNSHSLLHWISSNSHPKTCLPLSVS